MIRITQLKLPVRHTEEDLIRKISKQLRLAPEKWKSWTIVRQSIDAREKPDLYFRYTIDIETAHEKKLLSALHSRNVSLVSPVRYVFPAYGNSMMQHRPVVVGSGPAGLICAFMLAKHGYRPIVLERGASVEERTRDVEAFWDHRQWNPDSNVQFGEGGAGTFSDGKLNTAVKDKTGRNQEVLRILVEAGAPPEILYQARPHIGTDILTGIVRNIREKIISYGGSVHFHAKVSGIQTNGNRLCGIVLEDGTCIETGHAVFAIGHSARDTFQMLHQAGIKMTAKPFAVGVRIQHAQELIDRQNYGMADPVVGAADYKLAEQLPSGRSVYSFCMCPGGFVVNASSEPNMLAINGMSYHARDSRAANSAIIVGVTPDDYSAFCSELLSRLKKELPSGLWENMKPAFHLPSPVFSGMIFQRLLECYACHVGNGTIPLQSFGSFCRSKTFYSEENLPENAVLCMKGAYQAGNVRAIFPEEIGNALEEGIRRLDRKISGFASDSVILAGVESRTSSPVRIERDSSLQSSISGLYPCGEGAGYAGGITSAAIDGLRVAEAISSACRPSR